MTPSVEDTQEIERPSISSASMAHGLPQDFWERVRAAGNRLLLLDYDGTLAPFHVSRMQAKPSGATLQLLREIIDSGHTKIVIVSGRPSSQVRALLGGINVEVFGAHGFERSKEVGEVTHAELSENEIDGLAEARKVAENAGLKQFIEVKPASVAIHVRGLDGPKSREVEELAWNIYTPIAAKYDLECRAFNGGVEIRSQRFHKGMAVTTLLNEEPDDTFVVYIGDDETDEDAFKALPTSGFGIKVGGHPSDTAARGHLQRQFEVLPFLRRWHDAITAQSGVTLQEHKKSRLIVISNRLPSVEIDAVGDKRRPVGGLATALEAALSQSEAGGLWFGWSGGVSEDRGKPHPAQPSGSSFSLIGMDLNDREVEGYYNGFSNNTIWPLFHTLPTLAKLSSWQLEVYRSVNRMFAHALHTSLQENDLVWVHDYHLMLLGRELRELGWKGRLGFFLHIPFPALDTLSILPTYRQFLSALMDFDVIGFQTQLYMDNYIYACSRTLGAEFDDYVLTAGEQRQRPDVYPVGIDVEKFLPETAKFRGSDGPSLKKAVGERDIIIGVDRLDYTKALPQRAQAFERLLQLRPELKRRVTFVQISSPSRTAVPEYQAQKRMMDSLCGRINGEWGDHDWEPIRYLYRTYDQDELTAFYRESRVGLVTPLRDGMNLVAKEYVAAQDPSDPGVLVLSQFAGAVEELTDAVIVNPYLPEDIAQGIALALDMPLEERQRRHHALLEKVQKQTVQKWARDFIFDLQSM